MTSCEKCGHPLETYIRTVATSDGEPEEVHGTPYCPMGCEQDGEIEGEVYCNPKDE